MEQFRGQKWNLFAMLIFMVKTIQVLLQTVTLWWILTRKLYIQGNSICNFIIFHFLDINECQNVNFCGQFQVCQNTIGGFNCQPGILHNLVQDPCFDQSVVLLICTLKTMFAYKRSDW